MLNLPTWVNDFNKRQLQAQYLSKPWETLQPINEYTESITDDNAYEEPFRKELKPVFPHNLPVILKADSELLKKTPFGNTMTKEFAIAVMKGEDMGSGHTTDFLSISFSSTDYVGHQFGVDAIETEDTYLRLDRDLAELLTFLKNTEGIAEVFSADELYDSSDNSPRSMLSRGAHPLRKADIYFVMKPGWMDYDERGTTHGSGYDYDTHVPLLFWGGKIPHGSSVQYHNITDVAPTICTYLNIAFPNGCTGKVITEIFGN